MYREERLSKSEIEALKYQTPKDPIRMKIAITENRISRLEVLLYLFEGNKLGATDYKFLVKHMNYLAAERLIFINRVYSDDNDNEWELTRKGMKFMEQNYSEIQFIIKGYNEITVKKPYVLKNAQTIENWINTLNNLYSQLGL